MDETKKWIKCLDEGLIRLKCMDETSFKIVMLDENHMYMDESYKKTWNIWMNVEYEWYFGWQLEIDKCLYENFG